MAYNHLMMINIALQKNQEYTCTIQSWAHDGAGVARIGGRAVFVPGAVPGERWLVRIVKVTASVVYGKGIECLSGAPNRVEPDCSVYPRCGGCHLRHISYPTELAFKLERVNEAFHRIGGLNFSANEILGAESITCCRNKAVYAVSPDGFPGFYRPRSHEVIPVRRCLLQREVSDRAAATVCGFLRREGFPVYDERSGRGLVRHICTRNARNGALQVTVVATGGFGPKSAGLVEAIRRQCPEAVSVVLNVNKSPGNAVLSGDFYTLWGTDTLEDILCAHRFQLSPRSFYQVNPEQAERLYARVMEYAEPLSGAVALDFYCGVGTITLCLARKAVRAIGVECVPEAVANARKNARFNGINNVEFLCADTGEAAEEIVRRGIRPEVVVLDPPRKGLAAGVIPMIAAMEPARVVYVSCDPATLARDLKLFAPEGYVPTAATVVDMFPRTAHVETVVLMSRRIP